MVDDFVLTAHARVVITERQIQIEWVKRVFSHPEKVEIDSEDQALRHALRRIEEYGGRILRVIYNDTTVPKPIVTVYFDRTQRSKL